MGCDLCYTSGQVCPHEAMMLCVHATGCIFALVTEATWDTRELLRQRMVGRDATDGNPGTDPRQQHPRQTAMDTGRWPMARSSLLCLRGCQTYRREENVQRGTRSQHPHLSEPRDLRARRSTWRRCAGGIRWGAPRTTSADGYQNWCLFRRDFSLSVTPPGAGGL